MVRRQVGGRRKVWIVSVWGGGRLGRLGCGGCWEGARGGWGGVGVNVVVGVVGLRVEERERELERSVVDVIVRR